MKHSLGETQSWGNERTPLKTALAIISNPVINTATHANDTTITPPEPRPRILPNRSTPTEVPFQKAWPKIAKIRQLKTFEGGKILNPTFFLYSEACVEVTRAWLISAVCGSMVSIVSPHRGHNSTPSRRAECLKDLICDIWLVDIEFRTGSIAGKPISHFIHTNNPSHRAKLNTLDLLNALVHRIKDNPYHPTPHVQLAKQRLIAAHWTQIWERLYTNRDKNPDVAQDFFYNWMIASKRWNGNVRWKHEDLYPGLQEYWESSGSLYLSNGNYDLTYLETEFEEMNKYSEFYVEAIKLIDILVFSKSFLLTIGITNATILYGARNTKGHISVALVICMSSLAF